MSKYWRIFKLSLAEYFIYRVNFIFWRFRNVVSFLTLVFFWQAIYQGRTELLGYHQDQILTYVVGASLLRGIVLGSKVDSLAGQIKSGEITYKYLLLPWGVIRVWLTRDLAAKLMDVVFVILEATLIIRILDLPFYWPSSWQSLSIAFLAVLISTLLYFCINFFLATTAFWLDGIWAIRWLFGIIFLEFMSGVFFPLDVLPPLLSRLFNLTPFPYLIYFPIKIYLEQVSLGDSVRVLLIMGFWLVLVAPATLWLWRRGLKNYASYGG